MFIDLGVEGLFCDVQATPYLNKLPDSFDAEDKILVVDPMLATGEPLPTCFA
jgi:uracil phosphoribosyltransferase